MVETLQLYVEKPARLSAQQRILISSFVFITPTHNSANLFQRCWSSRLERSPSNTRAVYSTGVWCLSNINSRWIYSKLARVVRHDYIIYIILFVLFEHITAPLRYIYIYIYIVRRYRNGHYYYVTRCYKSVRESASIKRQLLIDHGPL